MRAVLLEVPEAMLAERRRLGLDVRDEVWNGVLHMVPLAGGPHQRVGSQLLLVLAPLAQHQGLTPSYETGLFRAGDDYRVPDQGAELVVEIRSEGDETYEKIGFYAELGVREMLIVHPEGRWVELLRAVGGRLLPVSADTEGSSAKRGPRRAVRYRRRAAANHLARRRRRRLRATPSHVRAPPSHASHGA
ncbi:MAG: Uma2 family endonuclease [Pseudonocardiaceae bacterium]